MSVYRQWALAEEEAMKLEFLQGQSVIDQAIAGANNFVHEKNR
jgi:hypothetical protein